MKIKQLEIKQFRCFSSLQMNYESNKVIVVGKNGTGKTSIFEALHYMCYLKSFRTHTTKDLLQFDTNDFFVKIVFDDVYNDQHVLHVGYSAKKKVVKLNKKMITSYKSLLDYYRVITLTEDDLMLIKGLPDNRRLFINKALFLIDSEYGTALKKYKQILHNRNAVLQAAHFSRASYDLWTEQLFNSNKKLVAVRKEWIASLEKEVRLLLAEFFGNNLVVNISYQEKKATIHNQTAKEFMAQDDFEQLVQKERIFKRTLFGGHLDDIQFYFMEKKARTFASRGQQKLFVLLIKVAQIKMMSDFKGALVFLLDDFVNDFDEHYIKRIMLLLDDLSCQKIFSSPIAIEDNKKAIFGPAVQILNLG